VLVREILQVQQVLKILGADVIVHCGWLLLGISFARLLVYAT
jgi:hypothetical protein